MTNISNDVINYKTNFRNISSVMNYANKAEYEKR